MAPPVSSRVCTPESEDIGQQFINTWGHYISLLNDDTETDVLHLLELLEDVRQKWKNCESELNDTRKKLGECEMELGDYKRRWKLLPTHYRILSSPPLATLEEEETENKENEQSDEEEVFNEPSTSKDMDTPKIIRFRIRRSVSVPLVNECRGSTSSDDGKDFKNVSIGSPQPHLNCSPPPHLNCSPTPPTGMCLNRIDDRRHVYERKRVFIKAVCYICSSNIRFGIEAVKCQLCKSVSHQHCSRRAPIPCIPWAPPPKATNGRLRLGDYCADVVPKLPHLIIRCVRYLNTEKYSRGLYTNSEHPPQDNLLFQLLHDKSSPDLKSYGPEAAAYCILKFLTDIRESLIPESSFKEFADACKVADNFEMEAVISELPIVHKNTLAYLVIHWKLLNEESAVNDLTDEVLAKALIPVIMRGIGTNVAMYLPIFPRLLSLSNAFWEELIEEGVKVYAKTPLSRTSSKKVMSDVSRTITVEKLQKSGSLRRF
uniref:Rac GTPase-activating protein 1 n=1 Tax=Panagrolaimus superbus TaxID=310955 RepID=A0A914XQX7_9BILA